MGAILPFVPRTAATKTTRPQDTVVAAAIIIFPGVRYERVAAGNGGERITTGVSKTEKPKPARH